MRYKIEIYGKGGESFIFKLNEEQYEKLFDGGVEEDEMDLDDICEILDVEDVFDTDTIFSGPYLTIKQGEDITIVVKSEKDEKVWESDNDFEFSGVEYKYMYNDGDYLNIEDYQKGLFFICDLETDKEFDPKLLSCVVSNLLDGRSELITDIKYNDVLLEKEFGVTSSKGFNYILS